MLTSWLQRSVLLLSVCSLLLASPASPAWAAASNQTGQSKAAKQTTTKRVAAKQGVKKKVTKKKRTKKRARRAPTVRYLPFTATNPNVLSSSVLVIDESGSDVLYAKRADKVMPVASITKIMTALVVLDAQQPLDEVIEITREDRLATFGNGTRLLIGTELTRRELLHLALMSSENRAAHALARNYPGGFEAFMLAMNAKAAELGMTSSHFDDATGLSSRNVSSAEDLAKLIRAASEWPLIEEFSTSESLEVLAHNTWIKFRNTNSLVSRPDWDIALQKTGYTSVAGRCLIMKTKIKDRPVLMVLLRSTGKYTRITDAKRIREWMEATWSPPQMAASSPSSAAGESEL